MLLPIYQVDAFTDRLFSGNPAAVVMLDEWLEDDILRSISAENNLSETAFLVEDPHNANVYHLRWFTPTVEVDLCGHATLAAAHVIFNHTQNNSSVISFRTRVHGILRATLSVEYIELNFPATRPTVTAPPEHVLPAFNKKPNGCFKGGDDLLLVFNDETDISSLQPKFEIINRWSSYRGVIITSAHGPHDFTSRFFAPNVGVPEDPVTGSAHTTLFPFWADQLVKNELTAYQASTRGGTIHGKVDNDRVFISGSATTYMTGSIHL